MPPLTSMKERRFRSALTVLMSAVAVVVASADELDCRVAPFGEFRAAFNQLADGLDYNDDGEIVSAPGKKLPYNDATRVAFIHYIAKVNPTVTITVSRTCSTCGGKGRGVRIEGREGANLGYQVHWVCDACSGRGSFTEFATRRLTYSGELPKKWDSPKLIAFRGKLNSARDGNAAAQLEVARACMEGKFMPKNNDEARDWFMKAALQGEPAALAPLAELYMDPANAAFHDYAFGLALSAVADPSVARRESPDFFIFSDAVNVSANAAAALNRRMLLLEAGLLAPRIAKGVLDKAQVAKVLSPQSLRKGFPPLSALTAAARADKRALFVRGLSTYLGFGHPAADAQEALRLFEASACLSDADAFLVIALHFDAAKGYPSSKETAWAFYSIARSLGSSDPFCIARLNQLAEDEVSVDWAGTPEILLGHLQQGRITPAIIRDLADLSVYRTVRAGPAPGAVDPFDTAATQEVPLSKAKVFSLTRSMLQLKLKVSEVSSDDESAFRKCWDDGTTRFYSVSGVVTFTNASSRRERAPFTLCFSIKDADGPPELLYLSAGTAQFGECPAQCGRGL